MKIWCNIHVIICRLLEVYNPIFSGVSSTYYSVFNERGILKVGRNMLTFTLRYTIHGYIDIRKVVVNLGCYNYPHLLVSLFIQKGGWGWDKLCGWWHH